jgi:hypothetical protein
MLFFCAQEKRKIVTLSEVNAFCELSRRVLSAGILVPMLSVETSSFLLLNKSLGKIGAQSQLKRTTQFLRYS